MTTFRGRLSRGHAHLIAVAEPAAPSGIVLVVHGGRARSYARVRAWQIAVLRMRPLAAAIARAHPDLAVYRLQLAIRGWNGNGAAPIGAARWALSELRVRFPDVPIVLVGHSMGARTSVRVADDPAIAGVVGLAPWLPPDEPVKQLRNVPLRILHGRSDRMIPEPSTRPYLARAVAAGVELDCSVLNGTGHAMVRRAADWHQLTAQAVAAFIDRAQAAKLAEQCR